MFDKYSNLALVVIHIFQTRCVFEDDISFNNSLNSVFAECDVTRDVSPNDIERAGDSAR